MDQESSQLARQRAVEALLGTADRIPEEWEDDQEFLALLDEQIWRCATCEWWVEVRETCEHENCGDCRSECGCED